MLVFMSEVLLHAAPIIMGGIYKRPFSAAPLKTCNLLTQEMYLALSLRALGSHLKSFPFQQTYASLVDTVILLTRDCLVLSSAMPGITLLLK